MESEEVNDLIKIREMAESLEDLGMVEVIPWEEYAPEVDLMYRSVTDDGRITCIDGGTNVYEFELHEIKQIKVNVPDRVIYQDEDVLPF